MSRDESTCDYVLRQAHIDTVEARRLYGLHFYNENDKIAASWLEELARSKEIKGGAINTKSIKDLTASDLDGFDQAHFFAGIGGWSLALRMAGLDDFKGIWTGSCPCQPFSVAGNKKGIEDERHLWPTWFSLIQKQRPAIIFGEQVESAIRHGWLDLVFSDLEGEGYACGASVLPACGIGAPHLRKRVFFGAVKTSEIKCVADSYKQRCEEREAWREKRRVENGRGGEVNIPCDTLCEQWRGREFGEDCARSEKAERFETQLPSSSAWNAKYDGSYRQKTNKTVKGSNWAQGELFIGDKPFNDIANANNAQFTRDGMCGRSNEEPPPSEQ